MPPGLTCPSCRGAMKAVELERRPAGRLVVDRCDDCQVLWFDPMESPQLAAAALIALAGSLIGALYPGLKAARQDAIDGVADALIDRAVERQMGLRREFVHVEQRQRAAGDLLGAAERIAVERFEKRRRIERGRWPDRGAAAAARRR